MKILPSIILILAVFHCFAFADTSSIDKLNGFTVEPYLLDVTTDSAVVAFRLDTALTAKVQIYDGNVTREFKSEQPAKSHFIKITGLKPGLTYTYEVICGDDGQIRTPKQDQSFQIRTACRPGESFSFAVYGDTRPSENKTTRYHQEVIKQVILHEPLFALVLGDMVDDGTKSDQWYEFFNVESKLLRRCAIYPVLGDTDFENGKGIYSQFFPQLSDGYYKFEWGGVQFFAMKALDTRAGHSEEFDAQSPQIKWLESKLSKEDVQKAPFRVVFLHDPVFISRGRSAEVLRRVWAPLFQKYKVDVVFASWHLYERSTNEQVTYIISGGGGAELIWMNKDPAYPSQADARQYHFCRVDLNSNAMTISAIAADGTVLDSITLTPRSNDSQSAGRLERAAKKLEKEILINPGSGGPELPVYFFSSDCQYCRELLNNTLPKLAKENNITLAVNYYELDVEGSYDLFLNAGAEFGRQGTDIPAIFVGRSVLGGQSEIEKDLPAELEKFRKDPQSYLDHSIIPFTSSHDTATIKEEQFSRLTFGKVIGAGLIDGIKPCALTTVIFLISYLALIAGTRKKITYTGGIFTLTVFITCITIGLAFFNFAGLHNPAPAIVANAVLLLIVAAFSLFSLIDLARCLGGSISNAALQLPGFLNAAIRDKIRKWNNIAITGVSIVLGIVFAGLQLVCAGQLYIPIITMISQPQYRFKAVSFLFSYNIAFILPLVFVFLLAGFVFTPERIGISKRKILLVKFALVFMFIAMAVILIFNLR